MVESEVRDHRNKLMRLENNIGHDSASNKREFDLVYAKINDVKLELDGEKLRIIEQYDKLSKQDLNINNFGDIVTANHKKLEDAFKQRFDNF